MLCDYINLKFEHFKWGFGINPNDNCSLMRRLLLALFCYFKNLKEEENFEFSNNKYIK